MKRWYDPEQEHLLDGTRQGSYSNLKKPTETRTITQTPRTRTLTPLLKSVVEYTERGQ